MRAPFILSIYSTLFLGFAIVSKPAFAGPFTDDLSKCLVSQTTLNDKEVLVRWIFSTMALHPTVSGMASVKEQDRVQYTKDVAALFERLLTNTCMVEAQKAVKFEGITAFETSFKIFGELAMTDLMADPKVSKSTSEIASYLDAAKLKAVFGEIK